MSDYFTLLGLLPHFVVDNAKLKASYLLLQKKFHPDNFIDATPQEKMQATLTASKINQAYQTLKDPLKRANYILTLHDIDALNENDTAMPMDFLMEQMQLREALEEGTQSPVALQSIIETAMQDCEKSLADYLDPLSLNLLAAKMCVRKMQFYTSFYHDITTINE